MDNARETGLVLDPKFGPDGLLTAVVTDAVDGTILMVGHMNRKALNPTLETGETWFFSRSRLPRATFWKLTLFFFLGLLGRSLLLVGRRFGLSTWGRKRSLGLLARNFLKFLYLSWFCLILEGERDFEGSYL